MTTQRPDPDTLQLKPVTPDYITQHAEFSLFARSYDHIAMIASWLSTRTATPWDFALYSISPHTDTAVTCQFCAPYGTSDHKCHSAITAYNLYYPDTPITSYTAPLSQHQPRPATCCGDLEDDWDYCPYCGQEITEPITNTSWTLIITLPTATK